MCDGEEEERGLEERLKEKEEKERKSAGGIERMAVRKALLSHSHGSLCQCSSCRGKVTGMQRHSRKQSIERRVKIGLSATMGVGFVIIVSILMMLMKSANAALLGIDLGNEFMKVALVKPGKIPISIAVNAMTKRKTPSLFGIVKGERLLGEDAAAIVPRYPESVFFNAREVVGVPFSEKLKMELFTDNGMKYEFKSEEDSLYASWKSENGTMYDAVELLVSKFHTLDFKYKSNCFSH